MEPRDRILRHPLSAPLLDHPAGRRCHAVGGTVRDAVLGIEARDLDVSVARDGEILARGLAETLGATFVALGGEGFSSYRVVAGDYQLDLWDRAGASLRADLERRDLTINSIGCDLDSGVLEDPCAGLRDLDDRILRATRLDCFVRDPLRILRLARFQVTLEGFTMDPATAAAALGARPGLSEIAVERVRDELGQILSTPSASAALQTLARLGALVAVFPQLAVAGSEALLLERADRLDRAFELLRLELPAVGWRREDHLEAALALVVTLDSDAPPGARASTGSAPETSEAAALLARLGLTTRKISRSAARLAAAEAPLDRDARRVFLAGHGAGWPLALAVAVARDATRAEQAIAIIRALDRAQRANPALLAPPTPLLDGNEIARILGVPPGPAVGDALRALVRAQILGRVGTRTEAETYLCRRTRARAGTATSPTPSDAG